MIYIIFDLETVVVRNDRMVGHIIEIGATKIKGSNEGVSIVDTFQTYVSIPNNKRITEDTLRFIKASKEDFEDAPLLSEAIEVFREWIGEEEYRLCTWSMSDMDILADNWLMGKFDSSWIINFNDIQPLICKSIDAEKKSISLKTAVDLKLGKQNNIKFHSAASDAYYTALLFVDSYSTTKDYVVAKDYFFDSYIKKVERQKEENRKLKAMRKMRDGGANTVFSGLSYKQRKELISRFY